MRLLVAIGVMLSALVAAGGAFAYQGDPMTLPENQVRVQALLKDLDNVPTVDPTWINPATGSPYTQAERESGVGRAQTRMGARRALPALGILALGGSALYTGWEIGTPLGNYIRNKITGDPGATITGATVPKWYSWCPVGTAGPAGGNCAYPDVFGSQVIMCGGVAMTGNCVPPRGWVLSPSTSGPVRVCEVPVTNGCVGDGCAGCQAWANSIVAQGNVSKIYNSAYGSANTCAPNAIPAGICYYVYRTNAQMEAATKLEACNVACIAAATNTINDKAREVVSAPPAAAMDEAETVCGGYLGAATGSATVAACRAAINSAVDPAWVPGQVGAGAGSTVIIPGGGGATPVPFVPFVLPRPLTGGETYPDYIERLREHGWIGDVVVTAASTGGYAPASVGALANPGTITRITVPGPTTVLIDAGGDEVAWPVFPAPPRIDTRTEPVEFDVIPGTLLPGGAGLCPCPIPAIEFGPLTSLSGTCDSFPFGVFCWVGDQLGSIFGADVVAPHFTVGPHDFGVFLGVHVTLPELTYDFAELPPAVDGWRAVIRDVLAFFMVLGGLFFFATRMLGRTEAPDPSGVDLNS